MGQILDQFAAECHDILKQDTGPEALDQVRQRLEKVLVNKEFIAEHLGPDADSPRNILYEDPELGFCIIAHVYKGAKASTPHDHGDFWAIYGQAEGVTEMTEWRKLEPPADGKPGKVEAEKTYQLRPGMAAAYTAGKLHSPKRNDTTKLIRIEGSNLAKITRDKYEAA